MVSIRVWDLLMPVMLFVVLMQVERSFRSVCLSTSAHKRATDFVSCLSDSFLSFVDGLFGSVRAHTSACYLPFTFQTGAAYPVAATI